MTKAKDELYVQFQWSCECGAELQAHGEHNVGFHAGREFVTCPKCGRERDLPTRPLRLFLREKNTWNPVSLAS